MVGTPLDPIVSITEAEGTPSPKISTTIPFPWEEVVKAYNSRFPTHPNFPYLKGTSVAYEETKDNDVLLRTRIVQLDMGFPSWISKLTGMEVFTVREDSTTDSAGRVMQLRGNNVSLFDSVHMYEECEYRQHPDNPQWTIKEQIAYLDIVYCRDHPLMCMGLKKPLENFARSLFVSRANNAAKEEVDLITADHNKKGDAPAKSPPPLPPTSSSLSESKST